MKQRPPNQNKATKPHSNKVTSGQKHSQSVVRFLINGVLFDQIIRSRRPLEFLSPRAVTTRTKINEILRKESPGWV